MTDLDTPEGVIGALYDTISGPADQARDWDRLRRLFEPTARILAFSTLFDGTAQEGVWSAYESRIGSASADPVNRGINSVQLVQDGRWWIASLAFDIEAPERPIPEGYQD